MGKSARDTAATPLIESLIEFSGQDLDAMTPSCSRTCDPTVTVGRDPSLTSSLFELAHAQTAPVPKLEIVSPAKRRLQTVRSSSTALEPRFVYLVKSTISDWASLLNKTLSIRGAKHVPGVDGVRVLGAAVGDKLIGL